MQYEELKQAVSLIIVKQTNAQLNQSQAVTDYAIWKVKVGSTIKKSQAN